LTFQVSDLKNQMNGLSKKIEEKDWEIRKLEQEKKNFQ
jgi:peptidoglycan hydrolase CwlO-like protein